MANELSGRLISRRELLKFAPVAALGAGVVLTAKILRPERAVKAAAPESSLIDEDFSFLYSSEENRIRHIPSGMTYKSVAKRIRSEAEMRELQEKAKKTGSDQLFTFQQKPEVASTPDSPLATELPADVLTEKDLQVLGIRIIQSSNTSLGFRKGAVKEGGELYGLGNIVIIPVNGATVSRQYLINSLHKGNPIFDLAFELLDSLPTTEELKQKRREIIDGIKNNPKASLQEQLISYILNSQTFSDERLINISSSSDASGLTVTPTVEQLREIGLPADTKFVYIAVGKEKSPPGMFSVFYYDEDGKIKQTDIDMKAIDHRPLTADSFPDPSRLELNSDYSTAAQTDSQASYVIKDPRNPILNLVHELTHVRQARAGQPHDEKTPGLAVIDHVKDKWRQWTNSRVNPYNIFMKAVDGQGYIFA